MSKSCRHEKAPVAPTARALGNVETIEVNNVMNENTTAASNVIPFDFRGHSVRAVTIQGEPWFVASDVCRVLDVTNTTQALQSLDDDERSMFSIGRQGRANIINESGLYTLILRSRDAVNKGSKAHTFRKWVTAEVLPSIREHGRYEDADGRMPALMDELLGKVGALRLSNVMRCRVAKLDAEHQRSATAKLSSAVHACFGVPRMELIPNSQFWQKRLSIACCPSRTAVNSLSILARLSAMRASSRSSDSSSTSKIELLTELTPIFSRHVSGICGKKGVYAHSACVNLPLNVSGNPAFL